MIFYFTATGNSLSVAKELSENIYSIPQSKGHQVFQDEMIGIVCPVYCGEIPKLVLEFLTNATFVTPYMYLILTYGKSVSDCPEFTFTQCQKYGIRFDYIASVQMVDNYLIGFDMDEEKKCDKHVQSQLETIKADLAHRKKDIPHASKGEQALHRKVAKLNKWMSFINNGQLLKINNRCVGCGICEAVYPTGIIKIQDGKARREYKRCQFCLACIHHCPNHAIQMKMDKNPKARYLNPNVTLSEIMGANKQSH